MADLSKFAPQPLLQIPEPPTPPAQPTANRNGQIPSSARQSYSQALKQYQSDRESYDRRVAQIVDQNRRIEATNREGAERALLEAGRQREASERATAAQSREAEAAAKRERSERNTQIAMSVGATVAGMAIGHVGAHAIKSAHAKHVEAIAKPTMALAKQAAPLMAAAAGVKRTPGALAALDKLGGIVTTAQRLKIGRVAGPVGVVSAGLLIAEGAFSRFVLAPQLEEISKTGAEAARAVNTASLFAATSLVGTRMLQNAMPQAINPASTAVATLEGAKNIVARMTPAAAAAAPGVASAVATAAKGLFRFASRATPAALAVTAATAAVASLVPSAPAQAKPTQSPTPSAPVAGSSTDIARQAAIKTAGDMRTLGQTVATAAGPTVAPAEMSDGRTDSYTRMQNGKTVRVNGYRTP